MKLLKQLSALKEGHWDDDDYDDIRKKHEPMPVRMDDGRINVGDFDDKKLILAGVRSIKDDSKLSLDDEGKQFFYMKSSNNSDLFLIPILLKNIKSYQRRYSNSYHDDMHEAFSFDIVFSDGKVEHEYDSTSFHSTANTIYRTGAVNIAIDKFIRDHHQQKSFDSIDKALAKTIVDEFKNTSIDRTFGEGPDARRVTCGVHERDGKFVVLSITSTPVGKGTYSSGNRVEIWYLPLSNGTAKRHDGAFNVPRGKDWLNDKVETIDEEDIRLEIRMAFDVVTKHDDDSYTAFFHPAVLRMHADPAVNTMIKKRMLSKYKES